MAFKGDDEQTRGQSFIQKYQSGLSDAIATIDDLEIPFSQIWPGASNTIIYDGAETKRMLLFEFSPSADQIQIQHRIE